MISTFKGSNTGTIYKFRTRVCEHTGKIYYSTDESGTERIVKDYRREDKVHKKIRKGLLQDGTLTLIQRESSI